jgi:hypothetical protein
MERMIHRWNNGIHEGDRSSGKALVPMEGQFRVQGADKRRLDREQVRHGVRHEGNTGQIRADQAYRKERGTENCERSGSV